MNTATLTHDATRTLALEHQQLLVLANRPGTRIKVLSGRVWLTEEGRTGDHFAHAGEELRVIHRGRAVIEGLDSARVQVIEPPRGGAARLQRWLALLRREPATVAARTGALALSFVLAIGVPELLVRGLHRVDAGVVPAQAAVSPTLEPG